MQKLIGLTDILYEIDSLSKNKPFPHTLLVGARGTGKTTLAEEIAKRCKQKYQETTAPALNAKNVTLILLNDGLLFIDEIHRLHPKTEEMMYQPMATGKITIPFKYQTKTIKLKNLTIIGATTRPSMLRKPMLSRFKIVLETPRYSVRDLARIVMEQYEVKRRDALTIASHVTVPREALNLTYRLTSLGMTIKDGLEFIGYKHGLSRSERDFLKILRSNGVTSLQTLKTLLQKDEDEVEILEERLIYLGFVTIGGRGRDLTPAGQVMVQLMAV